jgi:hypothetical protein
MGARKCAACAELVEGRALPVKDRLVAAAVVVGLDAVALSLLLRLGTSLPWALLVVLVWTGYAFFHAFLMGSAYRRAYRDGRLRRCPACGAELSPPRR